MNREGLTFGEWHAAAVYGVPRGRWPVTRVARAAWEAGEDPTEWAAALSAWRPTYHVDIVNNRTGRRSRMTMYPVTMEDAKTITRKITVRRGCRVEFVDTPADAPATVE